LSLPVAVPYNTTPRQGGRNGDSFCADFLEGFELWWMMIIQENPSARHYYLAARCAMQKE
jgi:hypothetical protein